MRQSQNDTAKKDPTVPTQTTRPLIHPIMRLQVHVLAITWSIASTPTLAFVPNLVMTNTASSRVTPKANTDGTATEAMTFPHSRLFAYHHRHNDDESSPVGRIPTNLSSSNRNRNNAAFVNAMKQWTMAALVATSIWASPAAMAPYAATHAALFHDNTDNLINNMGVASAKDKASGSGSRVNKDPESLLRYGLPIQNKEVSLFLPSMDRLD